MSDIFSERRALDRERHDFQRQAMAEFNKGWYPKLAALQARCGEIGHTPGTFHDNGLGCTWFYCSKCGARTGIEGPNGEADARATGLKSEGEKP